MSRLGRDVLEDDARCVERALRGHLVVGERVLALALLNDATSPWRQVVAMTEHRFARVALLEDQEPKVVEVPYADVRSSSWLPLVEFWTAHGLRAVFGRLAHTSDVPLLEAAMWDLTLPAPSAVSEHAEG